MKIVLASTSPRRREILDLLQIPFEVCAPNYEEVSLADVSAEEESCLFAREKALSLADSFPDSLLIGADTVVKLGNRKFGKPKDPEEAAEMLRQLSGKTHEVLSALFVVPAKGGKEEICLNVTRVRMKALSEQDISDYVATGEPLDKAGAYALQGLGGKLIEKVEGDYFGVVGLSLRDLADILKHQSVKISVNIDEIYDKFCSDKFS